MKTYKENESVWVFDGRKHPKLVTIETVDKSSLSPMVYGYWVKESPEKPCTYVMPSYVFEDVEKVKDDVRMQIEYLKRFLA